MWWPKNSGDWGIVLGIAALLLAVPASLLANFLTPKLRVWWMVRSLGSGKKKLNGLEAYMENLNAEPELSYSAAAILRGHETVVSAILYASYSLLFAIIYANGADLSTRPPHLRPGYLRLLLAMATVQVVSSMYAQVKIQQSLPPERKNKNFERR